MENYTKSSVVNELYDNIKHGGKDVPWTIPMGLWLNIIQRYLPPEKGWEVFLGGQHKQSTLYNTSIVNRDTLQPRFVIATLKESSYGMNDQDTRSKDMVRDATEYMLEKRSWWMEIKKADSAAAWKTTYVLLTLATSCRLYVLAPGSVELESYYPDRGYKLYPDALHDFDNIHSLLTWIAEEAVAK